MVGPFGICYAWGVAKAVVRYADDFPQRLEEFSFDALERDASTICGLSADLRLVYVNPAWVAFAERNGAPDILARWGIGSRLADVLPDPLRDGYMAAYTQAMRERRAWEHDYECSSPETYRRFRQCAYPRRDASGLIVVNSLVAATDAELTLGAPHAPDRAVYQAPNGTITACTHCRRVRRADEDVWDWVPAWVADIPREFSHGLCPLCFEYYWRHVWPKQTSGS